MTTKTTKGKLTHGIFQRKVSTLCKIRGCIATNIIVASTRRKVDIIASYGKLIVYIEIKIGKDKLRAGQMSLAREVLKTGGVCLEVRPETFDLFQKWITDATNDTSYWCQEAADVKLHPKIKEELATITAIKL